MTNEELTRFKTTYNKKWKRRFNDKEHDKLN